MLQPDIDVTVGDYNIHGFSSMVINKECLLIVFVVIIHLVKLFFIKSTNKQSTSVASCLPCMKIYMMRV